MHRQRPSPRAFSIAIPLLFLAVVVVIVLVATHGTSAHHGSSTTINIVAAENEYGAMVQAIGGSRVHVSSLMSNPNVDPHSFEASAATAETVAMADLVIKNGIGYDSWVDKLLSASPRSGRILLSVGEMLGYHDGDNPHVWYSPAGWMREATAIESALIHLDGAHKAYYERRKSAWLRSLGPLYREIAAIRTSTNGKSVIATEPVYGYMIAALGATSLDYDFQKAVMNGTDPSPRAVIAFRSALQHHTVRMLFYNSQVTNPTTSAMRALATHNHVPIVGVTETQPQKLSFVQWQRTQLESIRRQWR